MERSSFDTGSGPVLARNQVLGGQVGEQSISNGAMADGGLFLVDRGGPFEGIRTGLVTLHEPCPDCDPPRVIRGRQGDSKALYIYCLQRLAMARSWNKRKSLRIIPELLVT